MIRFGFSLLASCALIWGVVRQNPSTAAPGSPAEPTAPIVSVAPPPQPAPAPAVAIQEKEPPSPASGSLASPVVIADRAEPTALGRRITLDPIALQRIPEWISAGDCDAAWLPAGKSTFVWRSASGIAETPIEDLARFESGGVIRIRLADPGPEVFTLLELTGDGRGAIILRFNRLLSLPENSAGPLFLSANSGGHPRIKVGCSSSP